jgi:hypothetical protein
MDEISQLLSENENTEADRMGGNRLDTALNIDDPAPSFFPFRFIKDFFPQTLPTAICFILILISSSMSVLMSVFSSLVLFPVFCGLLELRMQRSGRANDTLLFLGLSLVFAGTLSWLQRLHLNILFRSIAILVPAHLIYSLLRCRFPPPSRSFLNSPSAVNLVIGHCRWCSGRRRRIDHHCLWINACVHAGTHADFVTTLALAIVGAITFTATTLTDLSASQSDPTTEPLAAWAAAMAAAQTAHARSPWDFTLALCFAPAAAGTGLVLTVQLICIAGNRTARDLCARGGSRPGSGPDAGPATNCLRFWAGRWDLLAPPPPPPPPPLPVYFYPPPYAIPPYGHQPAAATMSAATAASAGCSAASSGETQADNTGGGGAAAGEAVSTVTDSDSV